MSLGSRSRRAAAWAGTAALALAGAAVTSPALAEPSGSGFDYTSVGGQAYDGDTPRIVTIDPNEPLVLEGTGCHAPDGTTGVIFWMLGDLFADGPGSYAVWATEEVREVGAVRADASWSFTIDAATVLPSIDKKPGDEVTTVHRVRGPRR